MIEASTQTPARATPTPERPANPRVRLNVLVSFGTLKHRCTEVVRPDWDVFLDSGAFSNFKAGKDVVTLEQYATFLEEHGRRFWRYLSFDRIGDPVASDDNFKALYARCLRPVPIHQRSAPVTEFRAMAEVSDLVALGGIAGALQRTGTGEYIANMTRVARSSRTNVHLLGVGSSDTLTTCRPYSADSSDFSMGNRYARTKLWDARARRFVSVGRTDKLSRSLLQLLASYQTSPSDIANYEWWTGKARVRGVMRVAAWSTFRYVEHLARLGVKYFIAVIDPDVWILRDHWDDYLRANARCAT